MPKSLRNEDYSDLELLHVIAECSDDRGMCLAQDVAEKLKIRRNGKRTPAGTVSARFSWMQRYGYIERIEPRALGLKASDPPRWVITQAGQELLDDQLRGHARRMLDAAGAGERVAVMRELAAGAFARGTTPLSDAMRRQFMHTYANRRR